MNKVTIVTITKEVEGFKEPALTAESEDICPRNVKDLVTITIEITIIEMATEIIIRDGIITMVNRVGTIKITGITNPLSNNNSNGNNNRIIFLITFRQTISNQK